MPPKNMISVARNSHMPSEERLALLLHVGEVMLERRVVRFDRDRAIRHCGPPAEREYARSRKLPNRRPGVGQNCRSAAAK